MRLIDADKVIADNAGIIDCEIDHPKYQDTLREIIDSAESVDAVEVVRCKDCERRGDPKMCMIAFIAKKQDMPVFFYDNRGEWFCADGKRKEV